jgi:hypothetical protein
MGISLASLNAKQQSMLDPKSRVELGLKPPQERAENENSMHK